MSYLMHHFLLNWWQISIHKNVIQDWSIFQGYILQLPTIPLQCIVIWKLSSLLLYPYFVFMNDLKMLLIVLSIFYHLFYAFSKLIRNPEIIYSQSLRKLVSEKAWSAAPLYFKLFTFMFINVYSYYGINGMSQDRRGLCWSIYKLHLPYSWCWKWWISCWRLWSYQHAGISRWEIDISVSFWVKLLLFIYLWLRNHVLQRSKISHLFALSLIQYVLMSLWKHDTYFHISTHFLIVEWHEQIES